MRRLRRAALALAALAIMVVSIAPAAIAQTVPDIQIDSPIRGIEIDQGRQQAELEVNLINHTGDRQIVVFELEGVPEGWDVDVWSSFFDYRVNELVVEPTDLDTGTVQGVALSVRHHGADPGDYSFTLRLLPADGGAEYDSATYSVTVMEGTVEEEGPVSVRADIPTLESPPGGVMGFEIEVRNGTSEELSLSLSADSPPGWEVTFLEPFGEQRAIGAISVPEEISERVRIDVFVPLGTPLGAYEIPVAVTSEEGSVGLTLTAQITGQGELVLAPPEGQAPTAETRAGGQGTSTVVLANAGTADLSNIALAAEAPEDWEVSFGHPDDTVNSLPAAHEVEVPVFITPAANAAAGDYVVAIQATEGEANSSMELRVTVTEANTMAWLGLGIVFLVVGGMIGLFLKLGRR
jgi:uncharacterized membrane protein